MTCEPYLISCRLGEIARVIDATTWIQTAGLAVSALAALGTIWIAWMNVRLMRRQTALEAEKFDLERVKHELEFQKEADAAKSRRVAFAEAVKNQANAELAAYVSGTPWKLGDHLEVMREINRLGELTLEPSWREVFKYAFRVPNKSGIRKGDVDRYLEVSNLVYPKIDEWVASPESVDLTLPNWVE